MMRELIILIVTSSILTFAAGISIATYPQVTLQKGTRGVVPCTIEDAAYAVYWSKGATPGTAEPIMMMDNYFNIGKKEAAPGHDSRFDISEDFSLVIDDVNIADEGRYFCEGVSDIITGRNLFNYSDVFVYAIPENEFPIIDNCIEDSVELVSGEFCDLFTATSLNLTCSVSGFYPEITLFFEHNLHKLGSLRSTIWDNADGTKDTSVYIKATPSQYPYVCIASNIPGHDVGVRKWSVAVNVSPPVENVTSVIANEDANTTQRDSAELQLTPLMIITVSLGMMLSLAAFIVLRQALVRQLHQPCSWSPNTRRVEIELTRGSQQDCTKSSQHQVADAVTCRLPEPETLGCITESMDNVDDVV